MNRVFVLFLSMVVTVSLAACGSSNNHEGEAKTPSGSSIQKGRDYQDVVEDFEEKGFTNISLVILDDLITGWLTKDGEVESVSVDGDEKYSPDKWYPNDVEVVISYHTFPNKESGSETESARGENDAESNGSESENEIVESSEPEFEEDDNGGEKSSISEADPTEDVILTIENCEDFAFILSSSSLDDYIDFAEQYKGRTVEFDGCVTYLVNHGDYNTRYDILLSAWDYVDEETANPGPSFKFDNVDVLNLGIKDLYLPSFMNIGNNVHVIAEVVEFNYNTGLFFLKPISVTER